MTPSRVKPHDTFVPEADPIPLRHQVDCVVKNVFSFLHATISLVFWVFFFLSVMLITIIAMLALTLSRFVAGKYNNPGDRHSAETGTTFTSEHTTQES